MDLRKLDGVGISEIGMGCWQIGGSWGEISESDALAILTTAHESGVTFFDTADVYGGGRSEELIARFRKEVKPDTLFVATKLGRSAPGWPQNFTPETMRAHTDDSLRRLGVDRLDLTQLHCIPTEELRRGDVFETLRVLQSEGKIARFGASVESVEEGFLCLEQPGLVSLQVIFNLFRQKPLDELFAAAKAKGVAIIVRLPLASGLLSGKYTTETTFPTDDHRNFNRDGAAFNVGETFAGLPFETGVELADQLKEFVPGDLTLAQMAQRWILDFDAVTTVIPGARTVEQAKKNASIASLPPLSPELHARLASFYRGNVAGHIRGPY